MELVKTAVLGLALSYSIVCAYNQPVEKLTAAVSSVSAAGVSTGTSGAGRATAKDAAAVRIRVAQR